jgi:hypothetical protein
VAGKNAKAKAQRQRQQEAARRKHDAQEVLAGVGLDLADDLVGIGVVFEHLGPSQAVFFGVNAINDLCKTVVGVDVALFVEQQMRPSVVPSCPVFGVEQVATWNKPMIATSTVTCLAALRTQAPIVAHYVLYPDTGVPDTGVPDFADRTDISIEEARRAFCDPRVRVFVRSQDYVALLGDEFGIEAQFVPDFQITKMLKVVLPEVRR